MQFSCLLIGQDNLLIECGNYLIKKKHDIKWVVSSTSSIKSWCNEKGISCLNSTEELPNEKHSLVDYLFSIVNGKILRLEELSIARIASINYHDALLPKYAGVNATTWSLFNDEQEHGITWHHINEGIDEGNIVYQGKFLISENETALTLNLRCFEEAFKGFKHIVEQIESGTSLPSKKQSGEARSYYGLTHVLPNLGFINWQQDDALSIHRKVRALSFGQYKNNIGTIKLFLNQRYLSVTEVELAKEKTISSQAGQIITINDKGILVNTISFPVWLKGLRSKTGKPATTEALKTQYNLTINTLLPSLDHSMVSSYSNAYKKALSKEKYWLKSLSQATEHGFFTDRMLNQHTQLQPLASIKLDKNSSKEVTSAKFAFIAAIFLYLYRINNYENYTVYLQNEWKVNDGNELFANLLPISTESFHSEMRIQTLLDWAKNTLDNIELHHTYLTDLLIRQPELKSHLEDAKTVFITIGLSNHHNQLPKESLIHFDIDAPKQQLNIFHRIDMDYQGGTAASLLQNMEQHLKHILKQILTNQDIPIHQFSFLDVTERKKLLEWSIGEYRPLPSNTLTTLFEQRVNFSPDKTILFEEKKQITYIKLWSEAEKIASYLDGLSLEPMTVITLDGLKGYQHLAGALGILKSGHICQLREETISIEQPSLVIQAHQEHSISIFIHEISSQPCFATKNVEKSLPKQACLKMTKNSSALNQKQLINYCYWLANHCHFNEDSLIHIHKDLPLTHYLLQALAAIIVGTAVEFKENPSRCISHISMPNDVWTRCMDGTSLNNELFDIPHLLLTDEIESEEAIHHWQKLSPNSQLNVINLP